MKHQPICPKCGYDQSGEIATWETQCSVRGTCPECGHDFAWIDLFDPSRIQHEWFVEHAQSRWRLLGRTHRTLWMLLIPNRYWRRVTMETPRSMRRHLLWLVLLMAVLHALTTVALVASRFGYDYHENVMTKNMLNMNLPQGQQQLIATWLVDFESWDYWTQLIAESVLYPIVDRGSFFGDLGILGFAVGVWSLGISTMWLLLFCAFPATRKRTKLRIIHVVRAAVVAGTIPMLGFYLGRFLDALLLVAQYWTPMERLIVVDLDSLGIGWFIAWLIWVQWFWIAATRVGWKVRARWWELVLVSVASLMGFVLSGLYFFLLSPIQTMIEYFATMAGI